MTDLRFIRAFEGDVVNIVPSDGDTAHFIREYIPTHTVFTLKHEDQRTRSIDQNSLYQVWARDYAKHLLKKDVPTPEEHEAMKYTLQRHCYAETSWQFLLQKDTDLFTKNEKLSRRSTTRFSPGEMHSFLDWVQKRAAENGLYLEAKGEYQELKEAQNA